METRRQRLGGGRPRRRIGCCFSELAGSRLGVSSCASGTHGHGWGPPIDGTYYLVAGRDAERWTSNALRKMCGRGWYVIDGISFWHGDADHVVVGPGGVYVVETKHTDSNFDARSGFGRRAIEDWVDQLNRRHRSVRGLLREHDLAVEPLIIVWGGEVRGLPLSCGGIAVIHRSDLRDVITRWETDEDVLSQGQVEGIVQELVAYQRIRTKYEGLGTSP